jgi:hypothetical protein
MASFLSSVGQGGASVTQDTGRRGLRQVSATYTATNQYWLILELEPRYQEDPAVLPLFSVRSSTTCASEFDGTESPSIRVNDVPVDDVPARAAHRVGGPRSIAEYYAAAGTASRKDAIRSPRPSQV